MSFDISLIIFRIAVLGILFGIDYSCSEIFTALVEMEELFEAEAVLIFNLQRHIQVQERKLDFLKKKLKEYQMEHNEAILDIGEYLSNPINAYLLTKRLTSDWKKCEDQMKYGGNEFLENVTNFRSIVKFPSDEDLNGAAVALMRLQDTYNLETSSIAKGELKGIQYRPEMTSNDCFELGRQAYIIEDYYHSVLWMNESLTRLQSESDKTPFDISSADILEYLAFSYYKLGYVATALNKTDEILLTYPNHKGATGMKRYIEKEVAAFNKTLPNNGEKESTANLFIRLLSTPPIDNTYEIDPDTKTVEDFYEMLCRGDLKPTPAQSRPLRCRYVSHQNDFLKIAPFKLEEASQSPYIVIYHDVIYDREIEFIKNLSKPRFGRAAVLHTKNRPVTTNDRISKTAFIADFEHPYIGTLVLRAADITNLDMETSENLQVVNYGIGGHYDRHYDFQTAKSGDIFGYGTGNRIATLLFYLTDVEQGGATVFPYINVAVWPKKGSATFWYNLYASGEGDTRTLHASCPVLKGNKWVSNKWMHERGQEFRRRCELLPDHPQEE